MRHLKNSVLIQIYFLNVFIQKVKIVIKTKIGSGYKRYNPNTIFSPKP